MTTALKRRWALAFAALQSLLMTAVVRAQDATDPITTTTRTTETVWYSQWWVWAVGVAVFLIIIVALTNRGGSRA
jgi:hypothetical protein